MGTGLAHIWVRPEMAGVRGDRGLDAKTREMQRLGSERRAVSVSHCVVVRTGLSGAHHGHSGRQLRRIEGRIEQGGYVEGGKCGPML